MSRCWGRPLGFGLEKSSEQCFRYLRADYVTRQLHSLHELSTKLLSRSGNNYDYIVIRFVSSTRSAHANLACPLSGSTRYPYIANEPRAHLESPWLCWLGSTGPCGNASPRPSSFNRCVTWSAGSAHTVLCEVFAVYPWCTWSDVCFPLFVTPSLKLRNGGAEADAVSPQHSII